MIRSHRHWLVTQSDVLWERRTDGDKNSCCGTPLSCTFAPLRNTSLPFGASFPPAPHSSGGELPPTDLLVDWILDPRRKHFVLTHAQERTLLRVVARETQETAEISTFFAAQSVGGCYTTNGFDPAVEKEKGYYLSLHRPHSRLLFRSPLFISGLSILFHSCIYIYLLVRLDPSSKIIKTQT